MKKLLDIKRFKFYLWVGLAYFILFGLGELSNGFKTFLPRLLNEVWGSFYIIVLNYFCFEYILPKLSRKRLGYSFLWLLFAAFLCSVGLYMWRGIGIQLHVYTSFEGNAAPDEIVSDQFGTSIGSLFFFGIIRHIYNYIKLKQTSQQLRIEKQQAELNYLKSQTNPHFLFNTLNNIYSLARDKSDLAPESIMRLSKMLRYMLYETGGNFIAIEQELKIISDYIALEQLRYDESLHVNFNYDVEDMKQALPPLLLIPLVENAFKHGVSETRNQPFVHIHLSVKQRQLVLIIKNSADTVINELHVKENIGLSNLRRQLQLLFTDYDLSVHQQTSVFTAALKINLASYV